MPSFMECLNGLRFRFQSNARSISLLVGYNFKERSFKRKMHQKDVAMRVLC